MADPQYPTCSNRPALKPDSIDAVEALLERFHLGTGPFDQIAAEVDTTGKRPRLSLYGYASSKRRAARCV